MKRNRTSRKKGLLRFLVTAVVMALVLEGALRLLGFQPYKNQSYTVRSEPGSGTVYDAELGYRLRFGTFKTQLTDSVVFTAHHNADHRRTVTGFCKKEAPVVALFGCSFTYGYGLQTEETYASQLQQLRPDLCIENHGVSGYGGAQMLLALEKVLAEENKPAIVVVGYASFQDERATLRRNWRKAVHPFNRHLHLDTVEFPQITNDEGWPEVTYGSMAYEPWPLTEHSVLAHQIEKTYNYLEDFFYNSHQVAHNTLFAMHQLCETHSVQFVVAGLDNDDYTTSTLERCEKAGLKTVDIGLDINDPQYALPTNDYHPNAQACEAYAQKLSTYLSTLE